MPNVTVNDVCFVFAQQLRGGAMPNSDAAINDVCCHCQWRCQNLPDESREEPLRTGSVRVLRDTETKMWRCQLILKVQPSQPIHNFPVLVHFVVTDDNYVYHCKYMKRK